MRRLCERTLRWRCISRESFRPFEVPRAPRSNGDFNPPPEIEGLFSFFFTPFPVGELIYVFFFYLDLATLLFRVLRKFFLPLSNMYPPKRRPPSLIFFYGLFQHLLSARPYLHSRLPPTGMLAPPPGNPPHHDPVAGWTLQIY